MATHEVTLTRRYIMLATVNELSSTCQFLLARLRAVTDHHAVILAE
jgi:hypothetical protein